jgi:hypothetical protein
MRKAILCVLLAGCGGNLAPVKHDEQTKKDEPKAVKKDEPAKPEPKAVKKDEPNHYEKFIDRYGYPAPYLDGGEDDVWKPRESARYVSPNGKEKVVIHFDKKGDSWTAKDHATFLGEFSANPVSLAEAVVYLEKWRTVVGVRKQRELFPGEKSQLKASVDRAKRLKAMKAGKIPEN